MAERPGRTFRSFVAPLLAIALALPLTQGALAGAATPADVPVPGGDKLDAETRCLALAVYWEGKAESPAGQVAIAHTVLNRARSGSFPNTVCAVIAQGAKDGKRRGKRRCQFSWWCDGKPDEPRELPAWALALDVARAATARETIDPTRGALFFHNGRVRPSWAGSAERLVQIGDHVFYR